MLDDRAATGTEPGAEQGAAGEGAQGFAAFSQKLVANDPRMQSLQGVEEPTSEQQTDLRLTAMEIQQDIRYAQDDFKRLNPDATEAQVEEYVTAVYERDITTADRIQKEVLRKKEEKAQAEANDKKKSVALNTGDSSTEGGNKEDKFTGQNTRSGIRKILFGNS